MAGSEQRVDAADAVGEIARLRNHAAECFTIANIYRRRRDALPRWRFLHRWELMGAIRKFDAASFVADEQARRYQLEATSPDSGGSDG